MVCKQLNKIHYCTFQCDSIQSFQSNLIYNCCYKILRSIIHHETFSDLCKVKHNAYNTLHIKKYTTMTQTIAT
jgi:hypothetical protein